MSAGCCRFSCPACVDPGAATAPLSGATFIEKARHWTVRYDLPADPAAGRRFVSTRELSVLAPSLERALELVKAQFPNATVWGIQHIHERAFIVAGECK